VSAGRVVGARDGAIGTITLSAAERRNAISYAMREQLGEALRSFDEDPSIRVVVVTGEGSAFCSGVDLSDAAAPDPSAIAQTKPLTLPFDELTKPLIAAVNGLAVGGGFEIVLAADIRIAAATAWFALPEVRIGSLPGSGGTQRLVRAIPPAVAAALLYTGDMLSAEDAHRYGLVSAVVAPEELTRAVHDIATRIAANAPLSVQAMKRAMRAAYEERLSDGRAIERSLWEMLAATDDRAEGRAAFRDGRPPIFKGA
jgi:E-phenylitaconyl-CoA hydratase